LYIIRQGKIIETKATKIAIGGQQKDQQRIYENHEFELQNGDTIYLTTDGYADQFGGDKNKKLTTTKFKEMLLQIQNMTMQEQEIYLADFIEKWRSANEQVDDICVIGIRI
jgi:serine phosphatase RsbU (regulator of sigma subunit)